MAEIFDFVSWKDAKDELASGKLSVSSVAQEIVDMDERGQIEAVIAIVKIGDRWSTAWAGDVTAGGLAMAVLKLQHDVTHEMHHD